MKQNSSKKFDIQHTTQNKKQIIEDKKGLNEASSFEEFVIITFAQLWKKLLVVLGRVLIALKYQFHKYTAGAFSNMKLPWFKIGLAGLAIFILTKKDIQFSVNMKNPMSSSNYESQEDMHTESSLAQSINYKQKATTSISLKQLDERQVLQYIKRFQKVARAEMNKYGIPASIKMAQAILESEAGKAAAAKYNNNHFGTPMSGNDYASAWENWRAHSLLLIDGYGPLFEHGNAYSKWAKQLKKSGYSKDTRYDEKLIYLIETFELFRLDDEQGL